MTLQKAFAVDGGGPYPGPQLRMMQRAATRGAEGIVEAADLRVLSLETPGTKVRITSGQALILGRDNLSPGQVSEQGTYAVWNSGDQDVLITATGASPRVDLLVLRVEDPSWPGTSWDHDESVDPLVYPHVIEGVAPGTTMIPAGNLWSAIPLARIEMPASTATVQQSYIHDVRQMAEPRRERQLRIQRGIDPVDLAGNIVDPDYENWPNLVWEDVRIPTWATQVQMIGSWENCWLSSEDLASGSGSTDARGRARLALGYGTPGGATDIVTASSAYNFNLNVSNGERVSFGAADQKLVPAAMRGQLANLRMQVSGTSGVRGRLRADGWANFYCDLEFLEVPIVDVDA
jgi:hypothetical protein